MNIVILVFIIVIASVRTFFLVKSILRKRERNYLESEKKQIIELLNLFSVDAENKKEPLRQSACIIEKISDQAVKIVFEEKLTKLSRLRDDIAYELSRLGKRIEMWDEQRPIIIDRSRRISEASAMLKKDLSLLQTELNELSSSEESR